MIATLLVVLSWYTSSRIAATNTNSLSNVQDDIEQWSHYVEQIKKEVEALDRDIAKERNQWKVQQRTHKALQHELRVMDELQQAQGSGSHDPVRTTSQLVGNKKKDSSTKFNDTLDRWFAFRRTTLTQRLYQLQAYLQAMSLRAVETKYGPGPFYIRVTVDVLQPNKEQASDHQQQQQRTKQKRRRSLVSYTIQTVPTATMPHALEFFLDTVTGGAWNHTVLLHSANSDHVILAAPVAYTSQRVQRQALGMLGWSQLGFPEYNSTLRDHSDSTTTPPADNEEEDPSYCEHAAYTVGWAGVGPSWYVNTRDNRLAHGPQGNQDHHGLPGDADPCFGRVVPQDRHVIDSLVEWGMEQAVMVRSDLEHETDPWVEEEHRKTRIVSMELLATQ